MSDGTPAPGRFIRFVGWLREDGVFRLDVGWETPRITEPPRPSGDHRLELLDGQGQVLVSVAPQVASDDCQPLGGRMKSLRVLGYLPWSPGGATVRLRQDDRVLDARPLAPAPPEVAWEAARVADGALHLRWRARHSAPLTYAVGLVQGRRGVQVLDRSSASEASIPLEGIPLQGECQAVVLATDGLRSATASSDPFVLPAKAPVVTILRPRAEEVFSEIEGVPLLGQAMAPDGRSLPEEGLRWAVDGVPVTQGRRVGWVDGLGAGSHAVELSLDGEPAATQRVAIAVRARTPEEAEWVRQFEDARAAMTAGPGAGAPPRSSGPAPTAG
jgi:hypothetical protein